MQQSARKNSDLNRIGKAMVWLKERVQAIIMNEG